MGSVAEMQFKDFIREIIDTVLEDLEVNPIIVNMSTLTVGSEIRTRVIIFNIIFREKDRIKGEMASKMIRKEIALLMAKYDRENGYGVLFYTNPPSIVGSIYDPTY